MIYSTLGFTIDAQALSLFDSDGNQVKIRPKTCQLLIQLVKHQGEALTKQKLLDTVWQDTVVAEQVVFQSINELRQLFDSKEVIKTIPRKGYVWLPDVAVTSQQAQYQEEVQSPKRAILYTLITICFLSILGLYISEQNSVAENQVEHVSASGSVIVLPINNLIEGNDHSWVRLGMMDQLIQRLPSLSEGSVLETDYVLEVLERADAPFSNVTIEHIDSIFNVSGAELVIASKLHGMVADYQLSYTLYRRTNQLKGVLFGKNLPELMDQYATLINTTLGVNQHVNKSNFHNDFHDEMLGVAIDLRLEEKYLEARPLLESIVLDNGENVTAQRIYIDTLFHLGEMKLAAKQLAVALPEAKKRGQHRELARLKYYQAVLIKPEKGVDVALDIIDAGIKVAAEHNDWLQLASLTDLKAHTLIELGKFKQAEALFYKSKSYHQVLHCPLGESSSWANLAMLAELTGDTIKRDEALEKAFNIANKRNLQTQIAFLTNNFN